MWLRRWEGAANVLIDVYIFHRLLSCPLVRSDVATATLVAAGGDAPGNY